MASFTITSTTSLDGVLLRSNSRTVEVRSVMDYTKTLGATYEAIVTGDDHKMRLFSVNYKTVNNVKTDVTDMEKAIEDAKKQAEVISKDAEVISLEQEVISKDAEVDFLHNIQTDPPCHYCHLLLRSLPKMVDR